ncbi:MAG: flagellar biosynthesis anti-sigma factor FlgM [Terracidiphilus sp.]
MDIRSSLEGLRTILGVNSAAPAAAEAKGNSAPGGSALGSDRATLSSAGSEVAQSAAEAGVRMDKVESVQSALAAGTYSVPATAVASKMVDAMLTGEQ